MEQSPRRIYIPLLYEYYLFDYFQVLIPRLLEDGFAVTVMTLDERVLDSYASLDHPNFTLQRGNRLLNLLHRSALPYRIGLWVFGWAWAAITSRSYDFVVVPWPGKPLWYMLARLLPSLSCEITTVMIDVDEEIAYAALSQEKQRRWPYRVSSAIDRVLGGRYLMRLRDTVLMYDPAHHLIARLFGFWAPNSFSAFCGLDYFTVPGYRYKRNYEELGAPAEVCVTGSPAYEALFDVAAGFADADRHSLLEELGIPNDRPLATFFLSPSTFSSDQIEEVALVVEAARRWQEDLVVLLKFHPKTEPGAPERFQARLSGLGGDLYLMTRFAGDEFNARLILSSSVVVQKQGTVGFIAMLLKKPMVSYNLLQTDYLDHMYRTLGASFHAEDIGELERCFRRLDDPTELERLRHMQEEACREFCLDVPSPCSLISEVIATHFERGSRHR
jgi:hypothetical protein